MSVVVERIMAPPTGAGSCLGQTGPVKVDGNEGLMEVEESKQQEIATLSPSEESMVRDLLEKNGSPENPSDQYKALEQIMLDSERDICIFAGALDLLASQLEESVSSSCCSICTRTFSSALDQDNCVDQLQIKMRETEMARDESNIIETFHAAQKALAQFDPASSVHGKKFESRVSFNMRSGALTELRNQKAECLHDQRCFACFRTFVGTDITQYLQRVDRNAFQMQERLHVHS